MAEGVKVALSFENRERDRARKEKLWGWREMPKEIRLWKVDGENLVLPRGFRWAFEETLAEDYQTKIRWDDRRTSETTIKLCPPFHLRDHQVGPVETILREQDGIYQAPPGSGKTATVLEVIRRARQARNLVVVNSIEIAQQWFERAAAFVPDISCGIIGDGTWDERTITVATEQTLYSRRERLDADGWFASFGLACCDEVHHSQATTYEDVLQRIPSLYRFGVGATPDKTGDFERVEAAVGPVIHLTTREQLREVGFLIQPKIVVVETDFTFDFHSTFTVSSVTDCGIEGCAKNGKRHTHKNNYASMMKALREDVDRNALIAHHVRREQGHRQMLVSPQKGHLRFIEKAVRESDYTDPVYFLTGDTKTEERQEVLKSIAESPGLVLSTIGDEALDVPELDRGHMVWPTKNLGLVRQRIGRYERSSPGKKDAVIYDYADLENPLLAKHYAERRWACYAPDQMDVTLPE